MKILAFADVHGSATALNNIEKLAKKHDPDILICSGDLSIFEEHLDILLKKIASIQKPAYIIHGNHETEETMKILCARHKNTIFAHEKIITVQDYTIIGYGGGGFSQTEPDFEKFTKTNHTKITCKKIILITHAPPHKTKLDSLYGDHVGCRTFTKFIKQNNNTTLAISGHIHETAGKKDKINKTTIINPGPNGQIIEI